MKYQIIPVTPFMQNCTLLWCEQTNQAAVVDPGGDIELILDAVQQQGITLTKILLTHAHIDHVGATAQLAEQLNVPIEGPHKADEFWLSGLPDQSRMFGFPPVKSFTPTRWLADNDTVTIGNQTLTVLHCPGHTPGHVVFYHEPSGLAQVGDVLFKGSIGRTDFPQGDHHALLTSIHDKLMPLGDDVTFIPGHGPISTLGEEKRSNPFLR